MVSPEFRISRELWAVKGIKVAQRWGETFDGKADRRVGVGSLEEDR